MFFPQLQRWLVVAGATMAVLGLATLDEARTAPAKRLAFEKRKRSAAMQGKKEPDPPPRKGAGVIGCFWCIWFIIGNVWIFYFTPGTTFQAAGGGNTTDAHSTECAFLANFGFILIICLWIVPFVLHCILQLLAQQVSACLKICCGVDST